MKSQLQPTIIPPWRSITLFFFCILISHSITNNIIAATQCEGYNGNDGQKTKLFSYNVVFEPGASQEDILQYCGVKRLIEMAIEGFNATVFCYGQTGSGKTFTLTGPPNLVS